MIRRNSRLLRSLPKRSDAKRNSRKMRWCQRRTTAQKQADALVISKVVLKIESGDLRDMWTRLDCKQAAVLLAVLAQGAPPIDQVFAAAMELLMKFPNNAQRAGALRNMLPILQQAEEDEARCDLFT